MFGFQNKVIQVESLFSSLSCVTIRLLVTEKLEELVNYTLSHLNV